MHTCAHVCYKTGPPGHGTQRGLCSLKSINTTKKNQHTNKNSKGTFVDSRALWDKKKGIVNQPPAPQTRATDFLTIQAPGCTHPPAQ